MNLVEKHWALIYYSSKFQLFFFYYSNNCSSAYLTVVFKILETGKHLATLNTERRTNIFFQYNILLYLLNISLACYDLFNIDIRYFLLCGNSLALGFSLFNLYIISEMIFEYIFCINYMALNRRLYLYFISTP